MTATRKTRVLIVDDSAIVRKMLSDALKDDPDMEVVGLASDPFVARDLILQHKPDVVTLDIEMPRMDGLTFLKKVMAEDPTPVIVCSGHVGDGSEQAMLALENGAVELIAKPKIGVQAFLHEAAVTIVDAIRAAAVYRLPGDRRCGTGSQPVQRPRRAAALSGGGRVENPSHMAPRRCRKPRGSSSSAPRPAARRRSKPC